MSNSDFEFRDDATIQAVFNMEVGREQNNHNFLYNRSLPNQHPIEAITGLRDALDNNANAIQAEENRAKGVEGNPENLTTTDKENLVAAINEVDGHADTNASNIATHIADKNNPHEVTKAQVGLGNCDNTSDLDKPISTATQTALDGKQNNLTTSQMAAVNSGIDSTKVEQIATNASDISSINNKIPSAATANNQLTDKSYVDTADSNLQQQIDALAASSDVTDIVGTYAELQAYDTLKLKDNDIIKVLQDETENDATTYYRWVITDHVGAFVLIGEEGPYYTKSETDTLISESILYKGTYDTTVQYHEGDIVKYSNEFYEALQDNINVTPNSDSSKWSKLTNDNKVRYYERSDNTEFPIGLTGSNASGTSYSGYMYFTTHNKPTINASTGVITATGGIVGKTETAGDNSTKYATTAFVNTAISGKQDTLTFDSTPTQNSTNPVTSGGVYTALTGKADVATTLAGYGITDGANTALSNLSADGQIVIDSQNGTISNCVLEIPQNIKLKFSNGTVTLKAGSIITRTGSTYSTLTTTQDITWSSSSQVNKKIYLFASKSGNASGLYSNVTLEKVGSGDTLPANGDTYSNFYLTTDKIIYSWSNGSWQASNLAYPLAIIETDENGNITGFAKDSNGNDMIFNGACFVGHHAVVYPNVKALLPSGINVDGSLASVNIKNNALRIIEMTSSTTLPHEIAIQTNKTLVNWSAYKEVIHDSDADYTQANVRYYIRDLNLIKMYRNEEISVVDGLPLVSYFYTGTEVTDFTPRTCIRTATVEMLDKKQDTLTFDSAPTSASTNPVTSGGVYTALSGKQADVTTITGYDATKTQTLKNVSGVLTWVDD